MLALQKAIAGVVHDVLAHLEEVRKSSAPAVWRLRRVEGLERRIQSFLSSVESNVDRLSQVGQLDVARALSVALEPVRESVHAIRWVGLEIAGSPSPEGARGFDFGPGVGAYPEKWEAWRANADAADQARARTKTLARRRRPVSMGSLPRVEPEGLA